MTAASTVMVSEPTAGSKLGDALRGQANSLGLIRLILASIVIFDHAFPLGGFGHDPFWAITRGQASLGSLAVAGFFAISGYLIAKSGMSSDFMQFMWRRILRIFPAYWLVLALTAFVIAPFIWVTAGSGLGEYFRVAPNGPFNYLTANWTLEIGTYGIYDIFKDTTPYGQEVGASVFNGSLWTLIYEWVCYLIIGVMVAFGVLLRARVMVPILAGFFMMLQFMSLTNPGGLAAIAPFFSDQNRITLTLTFLLGSVLAVYSKQIPYNNLLGILSGIIVLVTLRYGGFLTIGLVAGTYFVMYLAVRLPAVCRKVGAKNDYSYGVYIYGFLVQQILAYYGVHELGYIPYSFAALFISFGCAWLSWHLLEKRAMALKDWGPGKGWQNATNRWAAWVQKRKAKAAPPASGVQLARTDPKLEGEG